MQWDTEPPTQKSRGKTKLELDLSLLLGAGSFSRREGKSFQSHSGSPQREPLFFVQQDE